MALCVSDTWWWEVSCLFVICLTEGLVHLHAELLNFFKIPTTFQGLYILGTASSARCLFFASAAAFSRSQGFVPFLSRKKLKDKSSKPSDLSTLSVLFPSFILWPHEFLGDIDSRTAEFPNNRTQNEFLPLDLL